ncbi:MAG TPA: ABC transporter substrate-binding protein [Methylomirabilota bacterium]|jgi:peptide/nickel transport system substrate-binding protein|nr:ABC transporter substrate-binding protein [Methylomirabilota bacterium]
MTKEGWRRPRIRALSSRFTIALLAAGLCGAVAAGALAQGAGKSTLIGKLEGPEVVTDAAKAPKTFKEAPQLAALVKAGKLPPVAERVGQDPLVIKPLHEIGKYGGAWRGGFTGPADFWNGYRCCSGPDHLMFWDYTGDRVTPNLAKGLDMQDGGRTWVLHLRRGMKWSDGKPFTADDFVFWFEDIYHNKDLVPTPSAAMAINGKQGTVEKVDASTVKFKFPEPYYMFPDMLAGSTDVGGQAWRGALGLGGYAPAHYLKQFHPKYIGQAELDKKTKDAKFDSWVRMFLYKSDWSLNPDLPVVSPWKTVTPINTPTWTLERNPYSVYVDTAGNQLPYIDRVVLTLAENLEVVNLRAIAGEYDWQQRHLDLGKLPVFLENQAKGGYKVYLDPGDYGGDMVIKFNLNYDGDPEIAKWFGTTDFRRALSMGIDRDQINETFWLGTGTPGSVVPIDTNKYNPGPQYRKLWATLDVKKANEMLDKIGLAKKDADGFRLRTDGKGRLRIEIMTLGGQFVQFTQISEMIREQWKKIGIDLVVQEVERSLALKRTAANEQQLGAWNNDGSEHLFTFPLHVFPFEVAAVASSGPLYAKWFQSAGTQGKEPTGRLKELMDKYKKAFGVPEKERIELGKEVWKIAADEVYIIGVIGMGPASMGVRVVKTNMGNVPARQYNSPDGKTPTISRPVTFYWKQ